MVPRVSCRMGQAAASFPYNIEDEIPGHDPKSMWKLNNGCSKKDGTRVSIFSYDLKGGKSPSEKEAASNCLKRCKTTRHPHLVRYVDGVEIDDGKGGGIIYVVTEEVQPPSNPVAQPDLM